MFNVGLKVAPAERPRLVDFLLVAERQMLDIGLRVWVGTVEVGLVGISAGRAAYAELPGGTGDTALQLLASLTEARIVPEPWTTRTSNVETDWRALLGERDLSAAGRGQRLAAAREALGAELSEGHEPSAESPDATVASNRALRIGLEALDWAAITAYLDNDLEQARRLLERREALGIVDLVSRANLERIRLRLLEDELEDQLNQGRP